MTNERNDRSRKGTLPRPRMRDEFRSELRSQLMREAVTALAPRPRTAWGIGFLRPALAVGMALVLLVAGAGYSTASSVAGDPAFALKRAAEGLQLALAPDDAERVHVLTTQLQHRLDELARVAAERSGKAPTASAEFSAAAARLAAAVDALKAAPPSGKRDAALEVAEAAREKHRAALEDIEDRLPAGERPSIERAKNENDKIRPHGSAQPTRPPTPRPSGSR